MDMKRCLGKLRTDVEIFMGLRFGFMKDFDQMSLLTAMENRFIDEIIFVF